MKKKTQEHCAPLLFPVATIVAKTKHKGASHPLPFPPSVIIVVKKTLRA
jgi:hypothetical protein